jgi:hypothetical protein
MTRRCARAALLALLCAAWCAISASGGARSPWRRPIVLVVTWHAGDLSWLAALPARRVQVALYIKGNARSCADVPADVRPMLAFCQTALNVGGREAHTAMLFLSAFYDALPRMMVFAHDDCTRVAGIGKGTHRDALELQRAVQDCGALQLARWDAATTRAWLLAREAAPHDAFADADACLCHLVHEPHFKPCPMAQKVEPNTCYGEGILPMSWILKTFLDLDPDAWAHIRWPHRAQFAVPAAAVRSRPRVLYTMLREILAADLEGDVPRDAHDAPALLHVLSPAPINKRWTSLQWAHSMERLWFPLFDTQYSPYKYGNKSAIAP